MSFVSKQWLRGNAQRNRIYDPERVTVDLDHCDDDWCRKNGAVAGLRASRRDGDFVVLLLDREELKKVADAWRQFGAPAVTRAEAIAMMTMMADGELLSLWNEVLIARSKVG
jgi:hypothetical protein